MAKRNPEKMQGRILKAAGEVLAGAGLRPKRKRHLLGDDRGPRADHSTEFPNFVRQRVLLSLGRKDG